MRLKTACEPRNRPAREQKPAQAGKSASRHNMLVSVQIQVICTELPKAGLPAQLRVCYELCTHRINDTALGSMTIAKTSKCSAIPSTSGSRPSSQDRRRKQASQPKCAQAPSALAAERNPFSLHAASPPAGQCRFAPWHPVLFAPCSLAQPKPCARLVPLPVALSGTAHRLRSRSGPLAGVTGKSSKCPSVCTSHVHPGAVAALVAVMAGPGCALATGLQGAMAMALGCA